MAFGNNYAYNPYINPYASPYNPQPQPMMQNFQQQQQPMPQIQQQTPQNGFVWVDGYWEAQGSYAGEPMNDGYSNARRGEHWVRGHYSRDGRRMYGRDGGYSYRRRDSRGRYSRADGKEDMMESMKEIMADATTEKEREIIRDAMSKLEKA